MTSLYHLLLRLYPAEYHNLFAPEMAAVHARAYAEQRQRGWGPLLAYTAIELCGVLAGVLREWVAKAATDSEYLAASSPATSIAPPQTEIERCRTELDALVQKMVHAIAHHDFDGARRYANEESRERERLRRLLATQAPEPRR